jgi:hypothetical protein
VYNVNCVFIVLTESFKLKLFLWLVVTLFSDNIIAGQAGGGHFQEYARLTGDRPHHQTGASYQYCDKSFCNLSSPFPTEWIKWANIPFQAAQHLPNPYIGHIPVQRSRDGQVILT